MGSVFVTSSLWGKLLVSFIPISQLFSQPMHLRLVRAKVSTCESCYYNVSKPVWGYKSDRVHIPSTDFETFTVSFSGLVLVRLMCSCGPISTRLNPYVSTILSSRPFTFTSPSIWWWHVSKSYNYPDFSLPHPFLHLLIRPGLSFPHDFSWHDMTL